MTEITSPLAIAKPVGASGGVAQPGSFPEKRRGGPITRAGKRRSAMNALRSGLYADAVLVKGEVRDEYLRFARAIVAGLDVQTALEMACAERVISALWRSRRARRFEQAHLNGAADEAERKREVLKKRHDALADHKRKDDALLKLSLSKPMSSDELADCAEALDVVFAAYTPSGSAPGDWWSLIPERKRVSGAKVAEFAAAAHEGFRSVFKRLPELAVFLHWVWQEHNATRRKLLEETVKADVAFDLAHRQTFVLNGIVNYVEVGKVLADAEARLDRQVTRALADLETARRLRPNP